MVRNAPLARVSNHELSNQSNFPIATAVSAMRLEKPHSLSYQPITRTISPSTTAVCVASKVQDAGAWLKSALTRGSVL